MFNFKNLGAVACALASVSPASSVLSEELSESGEFLDGVAAIVNEGVVLKSQYYDQLDIIREQAQQQGIPLPPENILQEQVLERVILTEIQLQRADRMQIRISDAMLNQVLDNVAKNLGGPSATIANLPELLTAQDIEYQEFRAQMREDITLEQLRRVDVDGRIQVSPREVQQCIEDLESNVVVNSEYNLSHILLQIPEAASAAEIDEILSRSQEITDRARDDADFRQLAIRYSQGPTALEGGSLGWMKGEEVPTIFTEILAPLSAGDVSDPYRTTSSIHIVKVNDMRGALERSSEDQVLARHILVTPDEIVDDATARQQVQDAFERIIAGEDFAEVAKLLSDDPGSANNGGELGWAGPGTFVPEFDAALNSLEIGELSEPFRSPFGWHIVELMDRRVYDNTEDLKEQNCVVRIRGGKREEETQLWLRRIRDEAFVDVRM